MTEDQKVRYRQMLADKKQGKSIDLDSFVKEVREEKLAEKMKSDQRNLDWLDKLSGSFDQQFWNEVYYWKKKTQKPLSWLDQSVGSVFPNPLYIQRDVLLFLLEKSNERIRDYENKLNDPKLNKE